MSNKDLYTKVHGSFICNTLKLEQLKCSSTGKWINKLQYSHTIDPTQQLRGTYYPTPQQLG